MIPLKRGGALPSGVLHYTIEQRTYHPEITLNTLKVDGDIICLWEQIYVGNLSVGTHGRTWTG